MKILILIRPLHFVSSHILVKKKKKTKEKFNNKKLQMKRRVPNSITPRESDSISPNRRWSKIKEHSRHYHRPIIDTYLSNNENENVCAAIISRKAGAERSQKGRIPFLPDRRRQKA